jgi:hypothetical protein
LSAIPTEQAVACDALPLDALPPLRLLPVPSSEPPYDDELPARPAPRRAPIGPLIALAPPALRLVPTPGGDLSDDDEGPARTPASELPPPRPVAQALVQGLLEVLAGVRPVSQLQRGTTPELFTRLEHLVHGRPRSGGARPRTGAVRSVHVQQQADGIAEVCATVRSGPRFATVALRLEGIGGRWCCTEIIGL